MSRRRSRRRHCGARNKKTIEIMPDGRAKSLNPRCKNWAMANGRCRLHGGLSTGPKSAEGKAAVARAMHAGRRLWIAQLKAQGLKIPGGRRPGADWFTPAMKARAEQATESTPVQTHPNPHLKDATTCFEAARLAALSLIRKIQRSRLERLVTPVSH